MKRLPTAIIHFCSTKAPLEILICGGKQRNDYPWTDRFIGGWPLPTWQRDLVWTEQQKISFIESVFIGYDLGSVMINELMFEDGSKTTVRMSEIVIDGQQRISALVGFVQNEFPVNGLYWRDLTRVEQRIFREREIGFKTVACYDEEKLKVVYNHLNFSGVAHLDSEQA